MAAQSCSDVVSGQGVTKVSGISAGWCALVDGLWCFSCAAVSEPADEFSVQFGALKRITEWNGMTAAMIVRDLP